MLLYSSPGSMLTVRWIGSDHWLSIWDYSFPFSREDETASLPRRFFFSQILISPPCCSFHEVTKEAKPAFIQSSNIQSHRPFLAYLMYYHGLYVLMEDTLLRRAGTSRSSVSKKLWGLVVCFPSHCFCFLFPSFGYTNLK